MERGFFITLEGTDGVGKTTQIGLLKEFLEDRGYRVYVTREPGGTSISEKLREILLDKGNSEMTDVTEMMIYAASRAQLVAERIEPALHQGVIVICDRFVDSSVAYQGYGRDLGDAVRVVNTYATNGLEPDITFFLDLDPKEGRARIGKEVQDRLEQEKMDFFYRVYDGYQDLCRKYPERMVQIDASRSVEEIQKNMRDVLTARMKGLQ